MPSLSKVYKLRDLVVSRVDLCKSGANQDAHIVLFKSDDGLEPIEKRYIPKSERDKMPKEDFAGDDESFPIQKPGDVAAAAEALGQTNQDRGKVKKRIISIARRKGQAYVDHLPESWKVKKVQFDELQSANDMHDAFNDVCRQIDTLRSALDWNNYASGVTPNVSDMLTSIGQFADRATSTLKNVSKELKEDTLPENTEKVEKTEKTEQTPEEIIKSMPESVQKMVAGLRADAASAKEQVAKANEKADNAEKIAKEERAKREKTEMIAFVQKELPSLPGTTEETADLLLVAKEKFSEEQFTKFVERMKAGNAAMAKSLEEVGGSNTSTDGTALSEMTALAKKMVADGKAKTVNAARAEIAKSNPELYNRYVKELH